MTFPLRGADGRFRRFLTRVTPLSDGEGRVVRWVGTNTDVEAERGAREAAERANQAKTDFLATMSHELRTPLNAIAGYAELLEIGIHGPVTDQQREAISRIQRSQRHLLSLINDVLNFAKLEAGRVEYAVADVAVCDAVDALEPLVAPQLRAKAFRYDRSQCSERCVVRADPDKLQQILLNLLSNAIKFTAAGGAVTLRCEQRDDVVAIEVQDTGIGIAVDRLEHVFAPFVQIDRRLNAPHEGTGLGLAISRDLARGMGGDLTAQSEPGVGSTFTLTLPRA
jgi:signal transduction histidine kinase